MKGQTNELGDKINKGDKKIFEATRTPVPYHLCH